MRSKYIRVPRQLTNEVIVQAFIDADEVSFAARRSNTIQCCSVSFGDLGWIALERVLTLIDMPPQRLRPVFCDQEVSVKRDFPANLSWLGLNRRTTKMVARKMPKNVTTYEELGSFLRDTLPFQRLAYILQKPIKVYNCDGGMDNPLHIFTVYPPGQVIGGADAAT